MSKELGLLNFFCVLVALGFLVMIVITALTAGDLLTTDTLFVITVCLLGALIFAINPLLYLKSEGKLPIPFMKKSELTPAKSGGQIRSTTTPLLDAKGRAVPPDVKAIVSKLGQAEAKDA